MVVFHRYVSLPEGNRLRHRKAMAHRNSGFTQLENGGSVHIYSCFIPMTFFMTYEKWWIFFQFEKSVSVYQAGYPKIAGCFVMGNPLSFWWMIIPAVISILGHLHI